MQKHFGIEMLSATRPLIFVPYAWIRPTPTQMYFYLKIPSILLLFEVFSILFSPLKRADIAVSSLTVTEDREKVVDFTIPYMFYTEDILLKKPSSKENTNLLQFLNPFDNHVWYCTLATLVIVSIAVFVINYFSPYGYKDKNGQGTSEEFSYFNSLWFTLACMLQQGGENTPRSLSGKTGR